MKLPRLHISPWVTLFIGYVLGYILYPVLQLWTCDCQTYIQTHNYEPSGSVRLSRWMRMENGRLQSSLTREEFMREYLHPPAMETAKRLGSPKYLSQEYTVRKKLLVGVVTAEKYLLTRAKTVYKTWGQDVTQIIFFVGSDCNISHPDLTGLPLVKLPGISDSVYPPQKKVFAVLKYMHDHYIDDYYWFMRADDDVYVRGQKLEGILSELNPSERIYLGRAGVGKPNDVKRLGLLPYERYCMGGPGVVFSREALFALAPHLDYCLSAVSQYNRRENMQWFNEDVELGRCVSRTIDVQCSTSREGRALFIQDYNSDALSPLTFWYNPVFQELVSIHPIKQAQNMYSLHHFYKVAEYNNAREKVVQLQGDIAALCSHLPRKLEPPWQAMERCTVSTGDTTCVQDTRNFTKTPFTLKTSVPKLYYPKSRYEPQFWRHFNATLQEDIADIVPQRGLFDGFRSEITHLVTLLDDYINHNLNEGLELNPIEVVDGYSRYTPELGREYILNIKFVQIDDSKNVQYKRVRLFRPLGQEIFLVPEKPMEEEVVNVIVAVYKCDENFRAFMEAYRSASLQMGERAHLILSVLGEGDNLHNVQAVVANYTEKYPFARITILAGEGSSESDALELGMSILSDKELAFLSDVSLRIQSGFLEKCRVNAVLGERIYLPVPFALYGSKSLEHSDLLGITRWSGQWAFYSLHSACLYKADYISLGSNLEGDIFERATENQLEIMEVPEHELFQSFGLQTCGSVTAARQRELCSQVRASASVDQLELAQYINKLSRVRHGSLKFNERFRKEE